MPWVADVDADGKETGTAHYERDRKTEARKAANKVAEQEAEETFGQRMARIKREKKEANEAALEVIRKLEAGQVDPG